MVRTRRGLRGEVGMWMELLIWGCGDTTDPGGVRRERGQRGPRERDMGTQGWGPAGPHPTDTRVPIPGTAMAARGDGCSGFGNLFTEIAENSAHGSLVARLPPPGDAGGGAGLQLCLVGADAAWFYLDGRSVRLNVSAGRALDREVTPRGHPRPLSSCRHPLSIVCPSVSILHPSCVHCPS